MPIRSSDFHDAFGDFSDLFAKAEKKNATIHEKAVPLLLGAVAYCATSPRVAPARMQIRDKAVKSWDDMLQLKQGQILVQADIRDWIHKWFPDPVQAERIPIELTDWMGKLDI